MVKTFKKAAVLALAVAIIAGFVVSTTGSAFAGGPSGYEGKPGNQAGKGGSNGNNGYEGQPGNQSHNN